MKLKKFICMCLSVLFVSSVCIPVLGNDEIDLYTNYNWSTINFDDSEEINGRSVQDNIDKAIEYVQSLNLSENGYSYIEEACLEELETYKENDVLLTSYTVLTPKTRATEQYFGSVGNNDFYVTYTSVGDFMIRHDGDIKSKSSEPVWRMWVNGAIDVLMCFLEKEVAIPITLINSVLGLESQNDFDYGSYNRYTVKFFKVKTRSILGTSGSSGVKKVAYSDQEGEADYFIEFCPVGHFKQASYQIFEDYENPVETPNPRDKNSILTSANAYYNRGTKITWRFADYELYEKWK